MKEKLPYAIENARVKDACVNVVGAKNLDRFLRSRLIKSGLGPKRLGKRWTDPSAKLFDAGDLLAHFFQRQGESGDNPGCRIDHRAIKIEEDCRVFEHWQSLGEHL